MRRTGTLMMVLGWLMLAGVIWWGMEGFLSPNRDLEGQVEDGAPVRLKRGPDGHFRAPGRINGQPVRFLVDTGATVVAVPEAVARRLGLERGAATRVVTANGEAVAYATRLDSVGLGGAGARRVASHIVPGMGGEEVLLGMSFLARFQISMRGAEMLIEPR
jgi:aspartyl protease family protein